MTELRKRILLVDDSVHLVRTVSDFLAFRGYEVRTAKTGEEGLEGLDAFEPDLVILDIAMPGMGGIGFLHHILTDEGKPRYPVLVLTAKTNMHDFFDDVDVEGFLAKPCTAETLEKEIRKAIIHVESERAAENPVKGKILLGEDDPRMAQAISEVLAAGGYEVETAVTGPEVLEQAPSCGAGAIVMKEFLRSMNGTNVAPILRLMPSTRSVPVILYGFSPENLALWTSPGGLPPGVDGFARTAEGQEILRAVNKVLA